MNDKEKEILNRAVQHLEDLTGFRTRLYFYEHPDKPDAILYLQNEDYQVEFNTEVKFSVNETSPGVVIHHLKNFKGIPLLVTKHVMPELMKTLEKNDINFIDAAGNAYIKVLPLFISVKGNKPGKDVKIKHGGRTFGTQALQVIFALLCNPQIINHTRREIAEIANVALGTVQNTIDELIRRGYLADAKPGRYQLLNAKKLLENWVMLYPEKLKPKYEIGLYNITENQVNNLQQEKFDALWGGEQAAAKLTNYLRPYTYTIYIAGREGEFILRNRLKKETGGNLLLMKKFWNFENHNYPGIVPPVLIYADLLATADPRNIETAKIIYEKEIAGYLQ